MAENDSNNPAKKQKTGLSDVDQNRTDRISSTDVDAAPEPSESPESSDDMVQALLCSICCEIMHDCIALQPCGHCFCAGCFSDWMLRSQRCPECRLKVKRVAKNHRMNNLIEIYLQTHQDKRRPDNDLQSLNGKNKIDSDIYIMPKREKKGETGTVIAATVSDSEGNSTSSDSFSEDSDNESDDSAGCSCRPNRKTPPPGPSHQTLPVIYQPSSVVVHYSPMQVPVCVQCSNYGKVHYGASGSLIRPATRKNVPRFVCAPQQAHVMCSCCRTFVPDRRNDPTVAEFPLECKVCRKTFCHLYFGCNKYGCKGCLNKFKDFTLDETAYRNIVNENYFESEILKKYLDSRTISWDQFYRECMEKLDSNEFDCKNKKAFDLNSDSIICIGCALSNFRDLAYEYRKAVPIAAGSNRRNCWYGRNCNTQKTKLAHAEKLNHICEQTRF